MQVSIVKNNYAIEFFYKPYLVEAVKSLPERRWDDSNKVWLVPTKYEPQVAAFMSRYGFKLKLGQQQKQEEIEIAIKDVPKGENLDLSFMRLKPYPFQVHGIAYGIENKRVIIADQPGLGKTLTSIAIVTYVKAWPCLVICPSSLKENWRREFEKVTGKKAMILTDAVKRNYKLFYEAGLADVFIVNYESLKKYFVSSISKPTKWTLRDVLFRKEIEMFKSVIIDELHRCFPYHVRVLTNKGLIPIGEIVENNLSDLLVASCDLSNNSVTYRKIQTLWKNELRQRKIYRIEHSKGVLFATEDHEIYTSTGRFKEVREIESGDYLWMLRSEFLDNEGWENNGEVLFQKLCSQNNKCQTGNQSTTDTAKIKTFGRKILRSLWRKVLRSSSKHEKVLRTELLGKMEDATTGGFGSISERGGSGITSQEYNNSNAGSCNEKDAFRKDESEQSNANGRSCTEGFPEIKGSALSVKGWKRSVYQSAISALRGFEFTRKLFGISNLNEAGEVQISKSSIRLQIRHSNSWNNAFDRGGREFSQQTKNESQGSVQNNCIELVRVESCEVYESTDYGKLAGSNGRTQTVYDLEVVKNHNYFAEGILVSNCKSSQTHQSKFTKGITTGKKYVIGLTGTPVVNKPKDLVSQLFIINQMNQVFGNYRHFVDTYCAGSNEASNLKQLNALLRNNCFIRREKQAVLTDLPDKQRQVVVCDISNRKEYEDAEKDLIKYLIDYKDASDEKIASTLRGEIMVKIGILKNISARGKLADVFEFVDDIMEAGEKLILFIHLKEVAAAVLHKYHGAVSITGADDMIARQNAVDRFQRDDKVKLIVCSIKAAGVGLTLTASSRVGFIEFPWTYADCEQCEDRAHRIGQKDSVTCYYFLGKNTIDSKIYKIIQTKKAIAQAVTGSTEQIPENIVDMIANLFNQKDDEE